MKLTKEINRNMFREYDIRGVFAEDLNEDVAYTIGRSYGTYIKKHNSNKVIIGRDNRTSSPILAESLMQGLVESGAEVINLGLVTTPMFYFARKKLNIPTGIMITASHNPSEYNGFKMSFDSVGNAYGAMIQDFYEFTIKQDFSEGHGLITNVDIKEQYITEIEKSICLGPRKIRCLVDLGNGTSSVVVHDVMSRLGIEHTILNEKKDLSKPSEYLDPSLKTKMEYLALEVVKGHYDIGIGLDGDADRVGVVDELGNIISADHYMIIMYRYLNKCLKKRKALFDVKCSKALIDELEKLEIEPVMYRTGNSYMNMMMQKGNFDFGGEFSGHVFFRDKWLGFDDGLYAGLRMIEVITNSKPLSELQNGINKYYATDEIKFKVIDDTKFKIIAEIKKICLESNYDIVDIDGVRITFDRFWILIRASNTGPNLTVRVEADDEDLLKMIQTKATNDLNVLIEKYLKG